jgi:hypothetical protein
VRVITPYYPQAPTPEALVSLTGAGAALVWGAASLALRRTHSDERKMAPRLPIRPLPVEC